MDIGDTSIPVQIIQTFTPRCCTVQPQSDLLVSECLHRGLTYHTLKFASAHKKMSAYNHSYLTVDMASLGASRLSVCSWPQINTRGETSSLTCHVKDANDKIKGQPWPLTKNTPWTHVEWKCVMLSALESTFYCTYANVEPRRLISILTLITPHHQCANDCCGYYGWYIFLNPAIESSQLTLPVSKWYTFDEPVVLNLDLLLAVFPQSLTIALFTPHIGLQEI